MVGVVLASLAAVWALFRFTKLGLAMRAAALRPAAASLAGVRVDAMLAIGWGLAAVLGAVAGLMALPSTQLAFLLPTFMQPILVYAFAAAALGGLESPVGAIVGGVAIGVLQALIIGYIPQISSELQLPFAFALILAILLVKPNGLFGRRQVAAGMRRHLPALSASLAWSRVVLAVLPFVLSDYNTYLAGEVGIFFIAILGLNILTGYTGQISIGHGAFMAIGGYTAAIMSRDHQTNLVYGTLLAFAICFVVGLLFGLPALRLSGAYLALATFALAISIPQLPLKWSTYLGGSLGVQASSKTSHLFGWSLPGVAVLSNRWIYGVAWTCAAILLLLAWLILRGRVGRAFRAVRDSEIAAAASGVEIGLYKTLAFGISAAFCGVAGALFVMAHERLRAARRVQRHPLAQLLIGAAVAGLGSLWGILVGRRVRRAAAEHLDEPPASRRTRRTSSTEWPSSS